MKHVMSREDLEPRGSTSYVFEVYRHGATSLSLHLTDLAPGEGPRLHRHPYEEVFVVHEGRATYTVGDTTLKVTAGARGYGMSTVMTPEEFHPWSHHLQLTSVTEALITALGSSPPVRRVRGRTNNVTGRYPSPKMGGSIQFESQQVEWWAR
jgi:hypothetical protein